MKLNTKEKAKITHEGAPAMNIDAYQELKRSLMACMLWEDTFYENGVEIAQRIETLVGQVKPEEAKNLAIEAREQMKLRHAPLLVVRAMAKLQEHKKLVSETLAKIIQRPDELTEFLAIYWKDGKEPLASQVKKGLAKAFCKFDAYQLAKYNRDGQVKLRDVMFLTHPKPKDKEQEQTWKQLVDGTLPAPDTWEVALSTGKNKKETWTRLLLEKKLGSLALLRNLRNMKEVGVDASLIAESIKQMKVDKVLPFRFISAAQYAPEFTKELEAAMLKNLERERKLRGKTILLIDVSASMEDTLSGRSEMTRMDAAASLAILARELCREVEIYTFSNDVVKVPDTKGFKLVDAIIDSQYHSGTYLGKAVEEMNYKEYDRLIVFTDEQSHDYVPQPLGRGYMINVANYENGVGYGEWVHIDGFSENILKYIQELENFIY